MRVLLDENLPHDLAGALTGHAVSTVEGLGWAGTKNGALLKRAGGVCDVFIDSDARELDIFRFNQRTSHAGRERTSARSSVAEAIGIGASLVRKDTRKRSRRSAAM